MMNVVSPTRRLTECTDRWFISSRDRECQYIGRVCVNSVKEVGLSVEHLESDADGNPMTYRGQDSSLLQVGQSSCRVSESFGGVATNAIHHAQEEIA